MKTIILSKEKLQEYSLALRSDKKPKLFVRIISNTLWKNCILEVRNIWLYNEEEISLKDPTGPTVYKLLSYKLKNIEFVDTTETFLSEKVKKNKIKKLTPSREFKDMHGQVLEVGDFCYVTTTWAQMGRMAFCKLSHFERGIAIFKVLTSAYGGGLWRLQKTEKYVAKIRHDIGVELALKS